MVYVYTIPNCPYCKELKDLLNEKNIEFEEIDVTSPNHASNFAKIVQVVKSSDVPMVRIDKQMFVPYMSFQSIPEAVSLVEKFNV